MCCGRVSGCHCSVRLTLRPCVRENPAVFPLAGEPELFISSSWVSQLQRSLCWPEESFAGVPHPEEARGQRGGCEALLFLGSASPQPLPWSGRALLARGHGPFLSRHRASTARPFHLSCHGVTSALLIPACFLRWCKLRPPCPGIQLSPRLRRDSGSWRGASPRSPPPPALE